MVQSFEAFLHGLGGVCGAPPASAAENIDYQNRRLRWVVASAYERVPYYRRLFDEAGITPDDIRTVEDLGGIPLTSRADIQSQGPAAVCARGVQPATLRARRTSGSSGAPLTIRRHWSEDKLLDLHRRLTRARMLGGGLRPRSASIELDPPDPAWVRRVVFHRLLRRHLHLHWRLPYQEIVRQLAAFRPRVIGGMPSLLCGFADQLTPADRERIRPAFLYAFSEMMTPGMREHVEEAFGAPVRQSYGSHELDMIAAECPQGGLYHVCERSVIVEVLRDGRPVGPGEEGELVATALHAFAMPLLRYRQADLVVRGPDVCRCGAPGRTIEQVSGRLIDIFRFPNGETAHPFTFGRGIRDSALNARRFQVVQVEPALVRIRVIARGRPPEAELDATARRIEHQIQGSARVRIELVDDIARGPRAKFPLYVSYERWKSRAARDMEEPL